MKLININKTYINKNNQIKALQNINLSFDSIGLITILGPSGCGKTTLLNIISGKDKNFEGELFDIPSITYLTQEFQLFESMSVIENLKVVTNDKKKIESNLKHYGLWRHRNRKVKKCSNGQKKRIQFIRSILQKPQLLLCDEPTASLDHENAIILMNALKEISREIQVVVVTHDIALAEKYSDRIIKMGKGVIEKDSIKIELVNKEIETTKCHKNIIETFRLVYFEMKSRISEHLILTALYLLSALVLFSSINIYQNIQDQSSYLGIYKNSANVIVSSPKSSLKQIDQWGDSYLEFDRINYQDVVKIVKNNESIIGVEAFYNYEQYENNVPLSKFSEIENLDYSIFKLIDFPIFLGDGNPYYLSDKPLGSGYLIGERLNELITTHENSQTYASYSNHISTFPQSNEYYRKRYGISIIDLIQTDKIPLLFGSYPINNNEVIIAKDTAELLMNQEGYSDYEGLLGKTFYIGVESKQNDSVALDYYSTCALGEYRHICYRTKDMRYVDRFEIKVVGISNIESNHLNYVFFNTEIGKNPVIQYYVEDYNNLYFDYVRFIINPNTNVNELLKEINKDYPMINSEYKMFNTISNLETPSYKTPQSFLIYCTSIFLIFISLIFLMYMFTQKRFIKEHKIMRNIGYKTYIEKLIHIGLISLSSIIAFLLTYSILFKIINKIARIFGYTNLLSFEIKCISFSFLSVFIIGLLIEILLERGSSYD